MSDGSETSVGADAAELERIAHTLRGVAADLDGAGGSLTATLRSVEWVGAGASGFGVRWNDRHRPQMAAAARFVRDAAADLDRQAAEQRSASAASGGPTAVSLTPATGSTAGGEESHVLDEIAGLVDSLGLGRSLLEILDEHPRIFPDDGTLARLLDLLGGDDVSTVLRSLEPVLDVGGAMVDLVVDFVEHPHLPFDERLVHAIVDMGARVGLDEGVEVGARALAGVLLPFILPGVGAALTPFVTAGVGMVVGEAMHHLVDIVDDSADVIDRIADVATEQWRLAKTQFGVLFELTGPAIAVVGGAVDLAGDVAGGLVDAAGGVVGVVHGSIGSINPWD